MNLNGLKDRFPRIPGIRMESSSDQEDAEDWEPDEPVLVVWAGNRWIAFRPNVLTDVTCGLKIVEEGQGEEEDEGKLRIDPEIAGCGLDWDEDNCRLNIGRRYIRLPNYGQPGHATLGNLHTTLLNAHGHSIEHFGAMDLGLNRFGIDQRGPISQLLRG